MTYLRAIIVWILIIAAESIHGTLREVFLVPLVGSFPARRIAVFSGMLVILFVAWLLIRWIAPRNTTDLLAIGAVWITLTVLFEFGLGRFVLGYGWDRLLEDYDLSRGGLMGLGLVFMMFSPLMALQLRRRGSPGSNGINNSDLGGKKR